MPAPRPILAPGPRPRVGSRTTRAGGLAAVLLALLSLAAGCVPLQSLEEARRRLGVERLVELPRGAVTGIERQEIHYLDRGSGGSTLLLVHGFGASLHSWDGLLPHLVDDFRVVAPDLTGFGLTERPRPLAAYDRQAQVELLVDLLDHLGIPRVHAVGHSYGGGLTMTLAGLHPERVESMVLIDSTAPDWASRRRHLLATVPPTSLLFTRLFALRRGNVRRALERSFHDDSLVTPERVEAYRERLRIQGVARAWRGLTARLPRLDPEREVRMEELDQPALVLWGAQDRVLTVEDGRRGSAALRHRRFVVIEAAGHALPEEKPEEVAREIRRFVRRVEAD